MYRPADELDVIRDALALVEAAHREDIEACRILMDNCNSRLVATFLARVAADLLEDMTESPAEAVKALREWHTGGG